MSKIASIHGGATPHRIHYLNEWMELRGVRQADLVKTLGVDKGTVSKWCAGRLPQEGNLLGIAAFLRIEPNDLFRHPNDDWMARFLQGRSRDELERIKQTLEVAFPKADGTNG